MIPFPVIARHEAIPFQGTSRACGEIAALVLTAQLREGRASPLESLSAREREVLQLVVEGRSSAEIAAVVHLSPKTVETYRGRLMAKLGVHDVPGLVRFAIEHHLTPSS